MSAGVLSAPGTQTGPCPPACSHRDCAATRRDAETRCPHCHMEIGYETRFYIVGREMGVRILVHAACEEAKVLGS